MKTNTKHKLPGLFFLWATYQLAEAFMHFYNDLFAFMSLMATVVVLSHIVARQQGLAGIAAYKLDWNIEGKRLLIVGLMSGLITYSLSFLISLMAGREIITATNLGNMQTTGKVLLCAAGTFLPSIAEDIITRGYLWAMFGKRWNKVLFVVVSGVFYVLNHTYKLLSPDESLLYLFITGISLAIPLILTNSLWYSVGLHWACNTIYRITNDVLYSTSQEHLGISSLGILMIVVSLSIPFNIYIIKRLKHNQQ